jgi:phosphocarrier protein HPr
MSTREVTIGSRVGLHARPAAMFVQAATAAGVPVKISKAGGKPVDARSILGVLALGAKNGDPVILEADGDGADAVLDSLVALLEQDLDEPAPADA